MMGMDDKRCRRRHVRLLSTATIRRWMGSTYAWSAASQQGTKPRGAMHHLPAPANRLHPRNQLKRCAALAPGMLHIGCACSLHGMLHLAGDNRPDVYLHHLLL